MDINHGMAQGPHEAFKVRSRYYLTKGHKKKGVKEAPIMPGYTLASALLIPSEEKLTNLMARWPLPPREKDAPPCFVVVFMLPREGKDGANGRRQHFLLRFERDTSLDAELSERDVEMSNKLWARCSEGSDCQFAADRVKILPYIVHGVNWVVCKLVNNQPGLICEALDTKQYSGDGYVEVDIDVEGFKSGPFAGLAKKIIDIVRPKVATLVIDLAFMLQGNEEAELPERIIGVSRLIRLDLADKGRGSSLTDGSNSRMSRLSIGGLGGGMTSARSRKTAARSTSK